MTVLQVLRLGMISRACSSVGAAPPLRSAGYVPGRSLGVQTVCEVAASQYYTLAGLLVNRLRWGCLAGCLQVTGGAVGTGLVGTNDCEVCSWQK